MNIIKNIKVPTGNICIAEADKGKLEFLSLGDYGKNANVKANFLGLTNEIEGVPNGEIMPLEEKWVVTLSTQYGCSMGCKFCDVHKVGKGINATYDDLKNQVIEALKIHPEVKHTKRLNIHYARMGEPSFNQEEIENQVKFLLHNTNYVKECDKAKIGFARMGEPSFNQNVLNFTYDLEKTIKPYIGDSLIHPVFTTMLPKSNKNLNNVIDEWTINIKHYLLKGDAGLQFSINSTNDEQRNDMFNENSLTLNEISKIGKYLIKPKGRKYTLNFALADNYEINAEKLRDLFDPNKFMVKITPLHKTHSSVENDIKTTGGYEYFTPYQQVEKDLIKAGFDVLVFVPSYDEDLGRITCGNAILSGSLPECEYKIMQ